jgi:transglutaminase-like putative cysteine protease
MVVPIKEDLPNSHDLKSLRYRVTVDGGDPSEVFQASLTQHVEPAGDSAAQITTRRFRVGVDKLPSVDPSLAAAAPSDNDREPNSQIESDDPGIIKLAADAKRGKTDPVDVALALEKAVHELVREKNFSQAFATAAETAKSREGDCTEHAVLLAAMLRASDIPARVAIGLVYVRELKGFGYHMWTEAYLDGHWIPLDATLGRGGIGPAHLRITHTNLAGASPYSSFLPVAQVLGRLKIEVIADE